MKIENKYCKAIAKNKDWNKILELRKQGIGGSDAGAIMGFSKYRSPLTVYLEKTEAIQNREENECMKNGKRLEPMLLKGFEKLYKEKTGKKITTKPVSHMLQSRCHSFMLGNIDGIAFQNFLFRDYAGVEIKTTGVYNKDEWKDNNVSDSTYAQCQHYMFITGLTIFFVPVLVNSIFTFRKVPRNNTFITEILNQEKWFWNCVENKTMPAPLGIDSEDEYLLQLYNKPNLEMITGDEKIYYQIEAYIKMNEQIKELKRKKKQLQQEWKTIIGNNKGIVANSDDNSHQILWSRFEREHFLKDQFKKEKQKLYKKYCKARQSSRLSVR